MKISKLFHTLYAFLMFLPVMVLPLFAININQKEVDSLTAQIEETKVVDFNQILEGGNFSSTQGWYTSGVDFSILDNVGILVNFSSNNSKLEKRIDSDLVINGHKYLFSAYVQAYDVNSLPTLVSYFNNDGLFVAESGSTLVNSFYHFNFIEEVTDKFSIPQVQIRNLGVGSAVDDTLLLKCFNVYDLTVMFGSGNEPSVEQFNNYFPSDYYPYTLSEKKLIHTGSFETLNNTDVGSQFLYSLYNPLKDYFNLPNYMNLGGLYDWFLLNLFSGYNSPVYFIIFDLMIYWLAMSVLWLIFDVLMYVPSMIHKMLDKARME